MPLQKLILRFIIIYVIAMVAVSLVGWGLDRFVGMPRNTQSWIFVVPIMTAAMDAGQAWYRAKNTLPEKRMAWNVAAAFTGVVAVFGLAQIAILNVFAPDLFLLIPMRYMLIGLLVMLVPALVTSRFFFSMGARNMQKATLRAAKLRGK